MLITLELLCCTVAARIQNALNQVMLKTTAYRESLISTFGFAVLEVNSLPPVCMGGMEVVAAAADPEVTTWMFHVGMQVHMGPENQKAYILWSAYPAYIQAAQIRLTQGCVARCSACVQALLTFLHALPMCSYEVKLESVYSLSSRHMPRRKKHFRAAVARHIQIRYYCLLNRDTCSRCSGCIIALLTCCMMFYR